MSEKYPIWYRVTVAALFLIVCANLFYLARPSSDFVDFRKVFTLDKIFSGFGTLFATFSGAWLAFLFARLTRKKSKSNDDVAAGNRTLFIISTMWSQMKQHQTEIVDPYRDKPDAWLNMNVSMPLNNSLSFDMKELSFLMEANPEVFQSLLLEEERFRLLAYMIEDRIKLAFDHAWPALQEAGVKLGENKSAAEVEEIIGVGVAQRLKVTTAGIVSNLDGNLVSLKIVFIDVRAALKAIYPDRKFVNFSFGV